MAQQNVRRFSSATYVAKSVGLATFALFVTTCRVVSAQELTGLQAAAALEEALVRAIERSEKSIVSIARVQPAPGELAGNPFQPDFNIPRPGMVLNPLGNSSTPQPGGPDFIPNDFATGVIIDEAGFIVTTHHAVVAPGDIWVTTTARRPMQAKVVGADPRSDLAVLKVVDAAADVKFQKINFGDPTKLRKGQIVIALGNPYAIARDGQASASWGIVANLSRKAGPNGTPADDARDRKNTLHHFGTLIQTDAKLNLGTSGGALLNLSGEMVGLTTSQAAVAGFEQSAGYAIPCDETFTRVVETLMKGKEVEYGLLGIELRQLSAGETAAGLRGVRVSRVRPGLPAARAGIRGEDIITQVAGKPITDVDGLMLQVGSKAAAADTTVTVERDGRSFHVPVTLAKYDVRGKKIVTAPDPGWRGLRVDYPSVEQLAPQINNPFEIQPPTIDPSVLAVDVAPDSPAWRAGLRRGMFVTHVRNVPVSAPKEFYAQVGALTGDVELRVAAPAGQPPLVRVPAE